MYFVYILYSEKYDRYYVGQTNAFAQRIERHNKGEVKSTRNYRPWQKALVIEKSTRSDAMTLERKLKNLSRERKRVFIEKYS